MFRLVYNIRIGFILEKMYSHFFRVLRKRHHIVRPLKQMLETNIIDITNWIVLQIALNSIIKSCKKKGNHFFFFIRCSNELRHTYSEFWAR